MAKEFDSLTLMRKNKHRTLYTSGVESAGTHFHVLSGNWTGTLACIRAYCTSPLGSPTPSDQRSETGLVQPLFLGAEVCGARSYFEPDDRVPARALGTVVDHPHAIVSGFFARSC